MKQLALKLSSEFKRGEPQPKALARMTDPSTSHSAAASVEEHLPALEASVLKELRRAGENGLTVDELVDALHLDKVTISPRLKPLCSKNLAARDVKTRPGKSGRQQTVWRAA